MIKYVVTVFTLLYSVNLFSQENIKFFSINESVIVKDILAVNDGIWLYIDDFNSFKSKVIKVNKENKIIANSLVFDILAEWEDMRWHPNFLGVDSKSNVFLYNLNSAIQDSSSISIYKIDSNGIVIWEKIVDFEGDFEIISHAQIITDKIICVGMEYNITDDKYIPLAFSISIKDGKINWKRKYQFDGFSAFIDIKSTTLNNSVILHSGVDENDNYYSNILTLDTNGDITYNERIKNNFFGNRIEVISDVEFLISGFSDGARIINYNVKKNKIIFDNYIYDAWDDLEIPLIKNGNSFITVHTTYPDKDIVIGSGVEMMINTYDLKGDLIDSVFYDYDKTYETQIWNASKGYDNKVYFCGILNRLNFQNPDFQGIWGYFDLHTSSIKQPPQVNRKVNIVLFPTIVEGGQKVSFKSNLVDYKLKIVNTYGKIIKVLDIHGKSNEFIMPLIPSGIYYVIFESVKTNQIGKIIVK